MKRTIPIFTLVLAMTVGNALGAESLSERERAEHVLNRLAFGPRPGDVEQVVSMGVDVWVARQLNPWVIDDAAVARKLSRLETIEMSPMELFNEYEKPFLERQRRVESEAADQGDGDSMRDPTSRPNPRPMMDGRQKPLFELMAARLIRAVESERQLEEVLVDFWMNHFNVFAAKGPERALVTSFEYDVIRPHIWGSFEDLVLATAKSPAMLVYLDNMRSVSEPENRPATMSRSRWASSAGRRRGLGSVPDSSRNQLRRAGMEGLNENYARELMELHTLGVDGGYSQSDVTELARILTGWSVQRPEAGGEFVFRSFLHDSQKKDFLGVSFPEGGGIGEGERAIAMLARHPSTARHIARKLCERLVADDPPTALVDRAASAFLRTGGNLRSVVESIVTSEEFYSVEAFRSKIKTPFEFVVSAVRALDGETDGRLLARALRDMGMPLYLCQPPTGYSDAAEDWVSSAAFLDRVNFSIALASGRTPGTRVGLDSRSLESSEDPVEALAVALLGTPIGEATREAIERQLREGSSNPRAEVQLIAGLIIGSPEFQRQ